MAESVSFVCSKCEHLISPEHARELVSDVSARFWQYDHAGQCPFDRAAEWNGTDKDVVTSIREASKKRNGK
jgi:hypothetical protein